MVTGIDISTSKSMVNHEKREGRRRRKNVDKNKTKIYNIFQKGMVIWKIHHSSPFYLFPWLLPDQRATEDWILFLLFLKEKHVIFLLKDIRMAAMIVSNLLF